MIELNTARRQHENPCEARLQTSRTRSRSTHLEHIVRALRQARDSKRLRDAEARWGPFADRRVSTQTIFGNTHLARASQLAIASASATDLAPYRAQQEAKYLAQQGEQLAHMILNELEETNMREDGDTTQERAVCVETRERGMPQQRAPTSPSTPRRKQELRADAPTTSTAIARSCRTMRDHRPGKGAICTTRSQEPQEAEPTAEAERQDETENTDCDNQVDEAPRDNTADADMQEKQNHNSALKGHMHQNTARVCVQRPRGVA